MNFASLVNYCVFFLSLLIIKRWNVVLSLVQNTFKIIHIFLLQTYNYTQIYSNMLKPAFLFDGRMILDHDALIALGYHVETIGKRVLRTKVNRSHVTPKPWKNWSGDFLTQKNYIFTRWRFVSPRNGLNYFCYASVYMLMKKNCSYSVNEYFWLSKVRILLGVCFIKWRVKNNFNW